MPNRTMRRAQDAASLRYDPQSMALLTLLQQRAGQFDQQVGASQEAASGVALAAKRAIRPTRQDFRRSAAATDARTEQAAVNVAGLGEAASPYKASFETESALADQLGRGRQRDFVNELRSRAVDARAGAAQEQRQLRGEYAADVGDIARQLQLVAGQQGEYASTLYQDLVDAAAERRTDRIGLLLRARSLDETIRHNRANERLDLAAENRQRARDRADARRRGGRRLLTPSQSNDAFDQIEQARAYIRQLEGAGLGSGQIRGLLLTGRDTPVKRVYDEQGRPVLNEDGTQKTTGGARIPQFDKDLINAAYDLESFNGLSPANVEALRARGLRPLKRYERGQAAPRVESPEVDEAQRVADRARRLGRVLGGIGG